MTRTCILFIVLLGLGGCSPWVNIPAQRGDLASHDPNTSTVHEAVTVALRHVIGQYPPAGPYAVIMPEGTLAETMGLLNAALPEGAGALADETGRTPVFRVAGIRIRGWGGQVDIIPPAGLKPKRLLSVYLDHDLEGWYVRRTHLWNMPLERALQLARPGPRYEPPVEAEPEPVVAPEPVVEPQPEPEPMPEPAPEPEPEPEPMSQDDNAKEPEQVELQFVDEDQPIEIKPNKQGVKWEQ